MNADELAILVKRRIEGRYRRIVFVHGELERINALAKSSAALAKPKAPGAAQGGVNETVAGKSDTAVVSTANRASSESFEDFVFGSIDFSVYRKIDAEEFRLLFDDGLDDYADSFFVTMFAMNREEVRKTIQTSYIKIGPFYLCKKSSPLLLSIMRTLHTSLDFAPLFGSAEVGGRSNIGAAAKVFNGLTFRHDDGMETKLFTPEPGAKMPGLRGQPFLCGTFYPLGKAWTITLIP